MIYWKSQIIKINAIVNIHGMLIYRAVSEIIGSFVIEKNLKQVHWFYYNNIILINDLLQKYT